MPAGRRVFDFSVRQRSRRRLSDVDENALEVAVQALLDTWPWLTEQYRLGNVAELPTEPVGAAIRRYLEHEGL